MISPTKKRIESIDILRGIVMVIMASDHVRDYFHINANTDDPMNLATTTIPLYFTRWISHFCAPVFVFLSGTSIYLQSLRKTNTELASFLIKRGLWLILIECTVISLAWTFNPRHDIIIFQVIWAIGISMVILGLLKLVHLPQIVLFILGVVHVFGHNILDFYEKAQDFQSNFWWDLFHHGVFQPYTYAPNRIVLMVYPFPAWTGVMLLGYCAGSLFTSEFSIEKRKKILACIGVGLILFFVVLRFTNVYGDPIKWSIQKDAIYTFLSFINVNKYPPSLLYLCITLGPALILLAFIENIKNKFTDAMVVFGRTAFFYYILHLYVIHLLTTILFFVRGHSFEDSNSPNHHPFLFVVAGEGYGLPVVYLIWIIVVVALYPLCKRYDQYKINHKEKWWLSYV